MPWWPCRRCSTWHAACGVKGVREESTNDRYRIERAPVAQRSLCRFRFERVPAIKDISSYQQGPEFPVSALPAEDVPNLVEVARQPFARKVQLEHDPEKWEPVFRKDHAQTKT
jgi:hypothetical protein